MTHQCIKCEKELHQSVCIVDNAGFGQISYGMISTHYGTTVSGYLCDECTTDLLNKGIIINVGNPTPPSSLI